MKLIINADDFGLTEGVNQAIIDLANKGTLSSTTVMVNMPFANEAIKLKEYPSFSIGLHFNLTEGKPISEPEKCSSLLDADGNFYSYSTFVKKLKNGAIKQEHILEELRAQYNKLTEIIECSPSHIDSHQNIHKQWKIAKVLINFSKFEIKHKIGLRSPKRFLINDKNFCYTPKSSNIISKAKYLLTDIYFFYLSMNYKKCFFIPDGELHFYTLKKKDFLYWMIEGGAINSNKVFEIPCHPAISTIALKKTKLTSKRVEEFELMASHSFQKALKNNNLINFNNFAK